MQCFTHSLEIFIKLNNGLKFNFEVLLNAQ